jgi:hypothetical protein
MTFHLEKSYLDVVTPDGVVVIAYWARLRWGRMPIGYAAILRSAPGEVPDEASTFGLVPPPHVEVDALTWLNPKLRADGRWMRLVPPIRKTLFESADGDITWECQMPAARASVEIGGLAHDGIGYAERLTLTIPPWKLPFNTLQWGRHASAAHAVTWIAWQGGQSRQFVWLDGVEATTAAIEPRAVRGLCGGAELRIGEPRDVCARPALARLVDRLPLLSRPVAGRIAAMFEHKMVAPSELVRDGEAVDAGWALFEEVTW